MTVARDRSSVKPMRIFCLVPLAWFFSNTLEFGLIGCWFATGVYATCLLLATGIKFQSGSWQKTVI